MGSGPKYHFPPTSTHGSSVYAWLEAGLTVCAHSVVKVFPAEKMADGSTFVKHTGVSPGGQTLPVIPTSACVPSIATEPILTDATYPARVRENYVAGTGASGAGPAAAMASMGTA